MKPKDFMIPTTEEKKKMVMTGRGQDEACIIRGKLPQIMYSLTHQQTWPRDISAQNDPTDRKDALLART